MGILNLIQHSLAFVGFLSGKAIFRSRFLHAIVSLNILGNLIGFVMTGLVYIVRHLQIGDVENSLHAAFQVSGTIPLIVSFCTIMYHKEKLRKVIDTFQQIYDRCEFLQFDKYVFRLIH